jgi:predicted nucleic acid-binding protein
VRLAADANVLLSAVVGGRARDVLTHAGVEEVLTTAATLGEVQEYLAHLARKKRLALETVLLAAASLPVTVVQRPADVPVWSNDNDFEEADVEWYKTAKLLKRLERKR